MDDQACSCEPAGADQTVCAVPPLLPPLPGMSPGYGIAPPPGPSQGGVRMRIFQGEDLVVGIPDPPEGFGAKLTLGDFDGHYCPIYEGLFERSGEGAFPVVAVPGHETEAICPGLYAWDVFFVPEDGSGRGSRMVASGFVTVVRTVGSGRTGVNPNLADHPRPPRIPPSYPGGCGSGGHSHCGPAAPPRRIVLSDQDGLVHYMGRAPAGSGTDKPVWRIRRSIFAPDGSVLSSTAASGVKWDDRLTATYT